jgi:hypothetical protein
MLMILLSRPGIYVALAWFVVLTTFALLERRRSCPDWHPGFKEETNGKWLAPVPLRLRFLAGAKRLPPGFGRDLLASYSAGRAAQFTEAIKTISAAKATRGTGSASFPAGLLPL